MSDTPRTDVLLIAHDMAPTHICLIDHAREIERELNAANERIELLEACNADVARIAEERNEALKRINRLEEAGDEMVNKGWNEPHLANAWRKAKEAKP